MEERLSKRDLHCPVCRALVEPSFLICPVCTTKLRQACSNCKAPLEALWQVCPYCETPVEPAAVGEFPRVEPRRGRRRSSE
jgi:RNA polymerase subunit RPABC4/transcription elongation factor Spt4